MLTTIAETFEGWSRELPERICGWLRGIQANHAEISVIREEDTSERGNYIMAVVLVVADTGVADTIPGLGLFECWSGEMPGHINTWLGKIGATKARVAVLRKESTRVRGCHSAGAVLIIADVPKK